MSFDDTSDDNVSQHSNWGMLSEFILTQDRAVVNKTLDKVSDCLSRISDNRGAKDATMPKIKPKKQRKNHMGRQSSLYHKNLVIGRYGKKDNKVLLDYMMNKARKYTVDTSNTSDVDNGVSVNKSPKSSLVRKHRALTLNEMFKKNKILSIGSRLFENDHRMVEVPKLQNSSPEQSKKQ